MLRDDRSALWATPFITLPLQYPTKAVVTVGATMKVVAAAEVRGAFAVVLLRQRRFGGEGGVHVNDALNFLLSRRREVGERIECGRMQAQLTEALRC